MSDESDQQATGASTDAQMAPADDTAADSQSVEQTGSQDQAGSDESAKADESDKGKAEPSTAGSGDKEQSEKKDSQDSSQPKPRRSSNRFSQLANENKVLKEENERLKGTGQNQDSGDDQDVENAKAAVEQVAEKVFEKRMAPVIEQAKAAEDDKELSEVFVGDRASQRTKYESKIRDMWKLPQYKDVAAEDLYKLISYGDVAAKTVETVKKASKEAKDSSTGGTSARKGDKSESAWDLSEKEFQERNNKVRASG